MWTKRILKNSLENIKSIINDYNKPSCNMDCKYRGYNCCKECKHNRRYKDYYTPVKYK